MKNSLLTLEHIYTNSIHTYADKTAFSLYKGETLTYGEFGKQVEQVRQQLLQAGMQKGDKAALLGTSMPSWNVCYFAAVTLGIVIVPILPDFSPDALNAIIKHSESKALFTDKLYAKVSKETGRTEYYHPRQFTSRWRTGSSCENQATQAAVPQPEDLAAFILRTLLRPKELCLPIEHCVPSCICSGH